MTEKVLTLLIFAVCIFLYYKYPKMRKGYREDEETDDTGEEIPGTLKAVVEDLARQDYFKYTDYGHYKEAMQLAAECLAEGGFNCTLHDQEEPRLASLDYRQVIVLGDELKCGDDYISEIENMKEVFTRIGLEIKNIKTDEYEFSGEHAEDWEYEDENDIAGGDGCTLTINNKDYKLFAGYSGKSGREKWWNMKILAEIVNDQLALQGKKERIYLSAGICDEDGGYCAFMTAGQYAIIGPFMKKSNPESIWSLEAWAEMHRLDAGAGK